MGDSHEAPVGLRVDGPSGVDAVLKARPAADLGGPPPLVDLVLEAPRAVVGFGRLLVLAPWLRLAPQGDAHPVLVFPGFLASDATTAPLSAFLRGLGYPAYRWRLGRNIGPTDDVVIGLRWSLQRLNEMHGRQVAVIGWSLGGVIARKAARAAPSVCARSSAWVARSAFEDPNQSRMTERYVRYLPMHHEQYRFGDTLTLAGATSGPVQRDVHPDRRDRGLAHLHSAGRRAQREHRSRGRPCRPRPSPGRAACYQRPFAQPENAWRPFQPPILLRHWYPRPSRADRKDRPMDRLSPLDVSFLHMEDADRTAHMHIASIGIFEGPLPEQHAIRDELVNRLHRIPRYRQRVQQVPFELARPVWVDATDFDIEYHLRRTELSAPGGDDELRALAVLEGTAFAEGLRGRLR